MNSNNSNGAGGYFRVHDRLFDWYGRLLGPIAIAVYNYLARCADQDGCCFPSYENIARKVGISRRAAIMAITKLGRYRLIEIQHRKNRREKRGNYTSNRYKIRLEAFTHAGANREVVHEVHQVVHEVHQVVHEVHPKDYPHKDNPIKEKEREGEIPPSTPPDSLSVSLNSSQRETTQTAGENPEAPEAERKTCPNDPIPANGKLTTGRKRQHQGNGAAQPLPVPWSLSDDDIKAAVQETRWTEDKVKDEAPKFRDYHLSKGTSSYDWLAEWRMWKRRGDEWKSREREHAAKNGKIPERIRPLPPLIQADQGQAAQIDKEAGRAAIAEIQRIMTGVSP